MPNTKSKNRSRQSRKVETAVIAAGGYGTRFLPFTKVIAKELLPLGTTPIVELLVEECAAAGIREIIITTRPHSDLIEKHFARNPYYEAYLNTSGKTEILESIKPPPLNLRCVKSDIALPYGNAQGVLTLEKYLSSKSCFLLLFGDDIVLGGQSSVREIINKFESNECDAVIGAQEISVKDVPKYGNIKIKEGTEDVIETLIQKPLPNEVVSNLVIFSQLVLTSKIFCYLHTNWREKEPDVGVALGELAKEGTVLAARASGRWVTVGDPANYLRAVIAQGVHEGEKKEDLIEYVKSL